MINRLKNLLEGMKDGIYLKGSRGGQVDTGKGIFQFNAAESFIIKNGEIKDPLRDVSLSGSIMEILNNVDALGSDFQNGCWILWKIRTNSSCWRWRTPCESFQGNCRRSNIILSYLIILK